MSRTLRYGLIGCGMMGREHIENLKLIPGSQVAAIADPDSGQQALNAAAVPEAELLADHRQLIARDDLDVLLIASPNHTHIDVLRDVLQGPPRPLLIEKPVVTTEADGRWLAEAARGWRAPIWVAMEYRFMPPVAELRRVLSAGAAGTLRMLSIREHRYPFLQKVDNWNRFASNTGGTLVEKCCHFFDLMRLFLEDEPVRVYASGASVVNHLEERYDGRTPDMIDSAYALVDFAGGARAMLELCMFAEGATFQEEITATGDAGRAACYVPGPARLWADGRAPEAEIEICPRSPKKPERRIVALDEAVLAAGEHHGGTYFQHLKFRQAVLEGAIPEVTLADGIKAVMMGAAAERSVREGRPVELSFKGIF